MEMKVRITFVAPLLGTAPGNKDIYEEHIGKNSADKDRVKDELKSLPADELEEKGKTVFHRTADGRPMLYDYQIKGFIKEVFGVFTEFGKLPLGPKKEISKYTHKRIVDNFIFVYDREIPLSADASDLTECVRPLRATTMRGERIALSCSEQAPTGTTIECTIEWLHAGLEKYITQALDYGAKKGIGQWRNSGMGRFSWEVI